MSAKPSSCPIRETDPVSDLFWPGDDRAGDHLTPRAFVEAMVEVETAWLEVLGHRGRVRSTSTPRSGPTSSGWQRPSRGNPAGALVARLRGDLDPESGALAAPRTDQSGRRRLGADADDPRRGGRPRRRPPPAGATPRRSRRRAPRHADGRAHPDPARRADHVRPQGRHLADRRARRVGRRPAPQLPGAARWCGRHHGRGRRARARPVGAAGAAGRRRLGLGRRTALAHRAPPDDPAR